MKKQILFVIMLCCLFLSGCADSKSRNNELKVMDLSGLPSVEIIGAEDGELPVPFPDQEQITETKGTLAEYVVTDEGAYYIVSYDNRYRDFMCRQYAIYKQDFGSTELLLLAEKLYDEGRYVTFAGTEHGELVWYQMNESQDTIYKCRLENSSVVEEALEGKEGESPLDTMERELAAEFVGWEQEIPEEYLNGHIYLAGQNERYTVFVQMVEHPYVEGKITDSYINVYDRKSGVMKQLRMEDYGSVQKPALSGDYIMFLTLDDVMSYNAEDDYFENVYTVQLDTMEVRRITDNSGKDTTNAEVSYSVPQADEGYLYFVARDGEDYTYQYLYYMETDAEINASDY